MLPRQSAGLVISAPKTGISSGKPCTVGRVSVQCRRVIGLETTKAVLSDDTVIPATTFRRFNRNVKFPINQVAYASCATRAQNRGAARDVPPKGVRMNAARSSSS